MSVARLLALALIVPLAAAAAGHGRDADADLRTLEHRWLAALRTHDRAFLDRLLAAGFVDIDVHGRRRSRAEVLASPPPPASITQRLHDLHVRRHGDIAVVDGRNTVRANASGRTVEVAFSDVFVRTSSGWRALSAQETLVSPSTAARDRHR